MKKWLRQWLGITKDKTDFEYTIDLLRAQQAHFNNRQAAYEAHQRTQELSIGELRLRIARLEEMLEELKRGDVTWKLAQAESSIKTLTSFLNEIWYNIDPTRRRTI